MAPVVSSPSRSATSIVILAGVVAVIVLLSIHSGEATGPAPAPETGYYKTWGPFYQHDIVSRPNFTDLFTVRGYTRTEGFGAISIFDDPITVKPDIKSETVGRVQGFQSMASLNEANVLLTQTLHLPGGTLTFVGQFSMLSKADSRLHCVGGTGDFEGIVHGFYEGELFQVNERTMDAILKVTVHYHHEKLPADFSGSFIRQRPL